MRAISAVFLLVVAALWGCAPGPTLPADEEQLERLYQRAIVDAESLGTSAIRPLTPISPEVEFLAWEGAPGESRVLLVNWTDDAPAEAGASTQIGETWVTLAPKVQDFCTALSGDAGEVSMRLRQAIGLPPDAPYDLFVSLWVDPEDVFRPCRDPQITDRDCPLTFPRSERFVTVADEHVDWIEGNIDFSYQPDGYPWTNLGYTYDWGNPEDIFGFSEYVIRAGADVTVEAIDSTETYCGVDDP